jgi:hypothetical protein
MRANAAPVGMRWIWTLAFGRHDDRKPTHGCNAASPLLRFLYWIYERRLLNQLKQRPIPRPERLALPTWRVRCPPCGRQLGGTFPWG